MASAESRRVCGPEVRGEIGDGGVEIDVSSLHVQEVEEVLAKGVHTSYSTADGGPSGSRGIWGRKIGFVL